MADSLTHLHEIRASMLALRELNRRQGELFDIALARLADLPPLACTCHPQSLEKRDDRHWDDCPLALKSWSTPSLRSPEEG